MISLFKKPITEIKRVNKNKVNVFEYKTKNKKKLIFRTMDEVELREQLELLKYLSEHGVPVELPIAEDMVHNEGEYGAMFFQHSGIRLEDLFRIRDKPLENPFVGKLKSLKKGIPELFKKMIVEDIVEIITKMHSLGVVHNHPHLGNFVIDPETLKVRIIDFKFSMKKIDFNSDASDIVRFFYQDYHWLYLCLRDVFKSDPNEIQKIFEKLIYSLPVPNDKKRDIYNRMGTLLNKSKISYIGKLGYY